MKTKMADIKMKIGDCPRCRKRTMVVLGAEATKVFRVSELCYNCKLTFDMPARIERVKDDNQSAT